MIVNQQSENDTLLHYYSKDVSIKTSNIKFPCEHPGYGGCPPENVTFKIEIIEGAEYGTIKNSETGEVNSVFEGLSWEEIKTNIFTYSANGLQPDSTARVTIRHSSSDADIQPQDISFTIKRNSIPPPSVGGSIYFQMDKKYVMLSDTVNIHLLWINEVSDTLEFLPMQRFRVEIAEGIEYGRLVDVGSGIQGDDLNDAGVDLKLIIETEIPVDLAKITLVSQADVLRFNRAIRGTGEIQQEEALERNKNNRKEPITPEFIIVGDHIVGIAEVIIDKNPFVVEITPEEISAGDTALITIKQQNSDGSLIEFPANQQFEIGMIDGCLLGKLSKNGIDTNYLYGITQPIYFIADTNAGSGVVKVRVGLIEMTEGNRSTKGRKTTESGEYCFMNTFQAERYKDAEIKLEYVILLGETKYYQARYADGKLVIDELSDPSLWNGGLNEDVWGENPVSIIEGDKLGVYWEKEKPIWDGTTIIGNLSKGLIRLVGRYWEDGKIYKVKLTARTQNGDEASVMIEVRRPNRLGPDKPLNIPYTDFVDVFGQSQNINEYCITESGKEGVPPQLPKAQAFKETKFKPQYRYEPWKDIEFHKTPALKEKFFKVSNTFVVNENNMGSGKGLPTNHINLPGANYIYEPTKASKIIARDFKVRYWNSKQRVCVNNNEVKPDGTGGGKDITDRFRYYYESAPDKKAAYEYALDNVISDLENLRLDRYNFIAQSRIVASYNPFQQTFFNAVEWSLYNFRYTEPNYSPEMLNEPDHQFQTYVSRIKYVFNKKGINFNGNNWKLGYEGSCEAYEKTYNPGEKTYHIEVMKYYKLFEPKKEN